MYVASDGKLLELSVKRVSAEQVQGLGMCFYCQRIELARVTRLCTVPILVAARDSASAIVRDRDLLRYKCAVADEGRR